MKNDLLWSADKKADLPVVYSEPGHFYFLIDLSKLSNRFLKNFKSSLVVKGNK